MRISDWSSDVCSSDLVEPDQLHLGLPVAGLALDRPRSRARIHARRIFCRAGIVRFTGVVRFAAAGQRQGGTKRRNRRKTLRSEEHTSELQSLMRISYAVFCLKKKTQERNRSKKNNIHMPQPLHK